MEKIIMGFLVPALTTAGGWLAKGAIAGSIVWAFGPQIVAFIGSILLNLSAYLLILAGNIFNWLIERTVVDFTGTLQTLGMMNGVDVVWTAFRDIANILIIGMFTFIALSIILGIKEYGQKKLIAHVLVIAILLNFSLLFTKMIIDASNFTAFQFYKSAALPQSAASGVASPTTDSGPGSSNPSNGISGRFLTIMGITGFWDTFGQLSNSASLNGSWSTLGYALTGTVLLLVVAGVLLYGSFLLASRAALLVFIMIISPIAFATYLIPSLTERTWGWKGWWNNLIRCAFFGPLLMLFLWASILILSRATTGSVSFGAFLANPANPGAWQVVVMYCFTVAFLFLSMRLASSFADSIGGFGWAQALTAGPLAFAGSFAWNRGRNLAGRGAANWQDRVKGDLGKARQEASRTKDFLNTDRFDKLPLLVQQRAKAIAKEKQAELDRLERKSNRLGAIKDSSFSPFKTKLGEKVMKELGVPGILTGGKSESFGARADKVAKEAATRAEKAALLTDKDREKMRGESVEEAKIRHRDEKQDAEKQLKIAKDSLQAIREKDDYRGHAADEELAKGRQEDLKAAHKAEIEALRRGGASDDNIKTRMAEHKTELEIQENKIKAATTAITSLEGPHAEEFAKLQKKVADYNDPKKSELAKLRLSEDILKEWTTASSKIAATTAEQIAHRRLSNVPGSPIIPKRFREDPKNDYTSRLARSLVEDHVREKKQGGDILKAIKAMTDATGGPPPASTTPPTGGHT